MEYYKVTKLTEHISQITDVTGASAFLVTGRERAALLDTCCGYHSLKDVVKELTDLPLDVILTHGHCDHGGGAAEFDRVWLNEEDWKEYEEQGTVEMRASYVALTLENFDRNEFLPPRTEGFLPLKDGQLFSLGDITLEAVAVPGHTRGMTCILIREEKILLLGDACNTRTFLFTGSGMVSQFRHQLENLLETCQGRYLRTLYSHGPAFYDDMIRPNMELCDEILAGTDAAIPFSFMWETELFRAADVEEVDGRPVTADLVYRKEQIK